MSRGKKAMGAMVPADGHGLNPPGDSEQRIKRIKRIIGSMILHRFMSDAEYQKLIGGETLVNTTDHGAQGQKTDSVGFCFFPEEPDEAIHWLSFLVDADVCVTMEVSDTMVNATKGRYRDMEADKDNNLWDDVPMLWRTEYCTTEYSLQQVKILHVTDEYRMYGRLPETASFWERIERLRLVGEMENKRRKRNKGTCSTT